MSGLQLWWRMGVAVVLLQVVAFGTIAPAENAPARTRWASALLFSATAAAQTGPEREEAYSDWDWDEISIPAGAQSTGDRTAEPSAEQNPTSKDAAQEISSEPETAPPIQETESLQAAPDSSSQQVETSEASAPVDSSVKIEEGELTFDLDWPEDLVPEETKVGDDQRSRRRASKQAKMKKLANKPRIGSTAEPDFESSISEGYRLFEGMPPYFVIPSKKDPDMHPCLDCHDWAESDLTPRILKEPHDNFRLRHGLHGKGEFWCLTCHHLEGDGGLKTFEGVKLSFDEAYILCSQCHSQEAKDWAFGAHGKRVDNWRGERRILNCTACHYQHNPKYDVRKPMAGPPLRMGLVPPDHRVQDETKVTHRHKTVKVWERYTQAPQEEAEQNRVQE